MTNEMLGKLPQINWIKNDPEKYKHFTEGSTFLVALKVRRNKDGTEFWDFDVVTCECDDEGVNLMYRGYAREPYDAWTWRDFEYFALLEGKMPTSGEESE
jgi:hypothetical protein